MGETQRNIENDLTELIEERNASNTFANHCASANILMLESFAMTAICELVRRLRTLDNGAYLHNERLRKDREAQQPVTREWWLERFGEIDEVFIGKDAVLLWHKGDIYLRTLPDCQMHSHTRSDIETLVRLFGGEA